jgi:glutathione S-transferase
MAGLTLYVDSNFTSPYAMACYVTLLEKKLPFELRTVNLDKDEQHGPEYSKLALTGRVPALVHGDFILNESSAIIEYLEEVFPAPEYAAVLPSDLQARARARQVQAWIRSDLLALRAERSTNVIFFARTDTPLTEAGQAAATRLFGIAERLVEGENLFGEWCIADTDLALMINRLAINGDPVPDKLASFASKQWQRPSVQAWVNQSRV